MAGSMRSGPAQPHVTSSGASIGASQPSVHASVGAEKSAAIGSKHGAQRSPLGQMSWGKKTPWLATNGMQLDRHRPSEPPTDVQLCGLILPPLAMSASGAQKPPVQGASNACSAVGTSSLGTQWAPPQLGSHSGK